MLSVQADFFAPRIVKRVADDLPAEKLSDESLIQLQSSARYALIFEHSESIMGPVETLETILVLASVGTGSAGPCTN